MLLCTLKLHGDDDIVTARQRARDIGRRVGFAPGDQARVATAVSELVRLVVSHSGRGSLEFHIEGASAPQLLSIRITDNSPPDEPEAPSGDTPAGAIGARRLVDSFDIARSAQRTVYTIKQVFPRNTPVWTESEARVLMLEIEQDVRRRPMGVLDELKQQNRELADTLQQLEDRQRELTRLNSELFDTNRGVLALYAELDEKAEHLRNADELKTRFLSNMSHEFRTPLNSILALTRLLNERVDGPLSGEQEKQVGYIRKSALELLELVNDLLDLAKVEAGKIVVRPIQFNLAEMFSALRGMLRPLLVSQNVTLSFDEVDDVGMLFSDEGKVSQVLRNFLSNALKFTEHGEIRVSARSEPVDGKPGVVLCVADTGIGIAPEDHERIFEEFTQVESPLQKRFKGTGLGLPLCRKLAQLLGGRVWVESELGDGARFYLALPLQYESQAAEPVEPRPEDLPRDRLVALLVEDRLEDRAVVEACLRDSPFIVMSTDRVSRAREILVANDPAVAILDIALRGEDSWHFIPEVRRASVPIVVVSTADERSKGNALGVDTWGIKPIGRQWLCESLAHVVIRERVRKAVLVDDDMALRTLLKVMLAPHVDVLAEASDGREGWEVIRREQPDLAIIDLTMPGMNGMVLLRKLRAEAGTGRRAIVVCTSSDLSPRERALVDELDAVLLSKSDLDRDMVHDAVLRALARAQNRGALPEAARAGVA